MEREADKHTGRGARTAGRTTGGMKPRRAWAAMIGLSVVLTVGVAGCGSGGGASSGNAGNGAGGGGGSSGGSTGNTSSSTAATNNPSGTIVDGLFEEPGNLNPILGPNETFSEIVDAALYQNLFTVQPNGQLAPALATEVPTVANGGISADGLTYTFHLNPNAKWSNGDPVTSKDVEITYKMITNPAVNASSRLGWDDVESFTIVNDHEFKIKLKQPDPGFIDDAFANPMPGIIPYSVFGNMDPKDVNTASFNHNPTVTDGPYKFVSWVPGASISVTANPYWFGPKPKTPNIEFKIIPDQNTLLTNAQAHAINVWYFDPITSLSQIQAISGADVHATPQPGFEMGLINERNPILQDVRVRQALEMAINRQAIVQQIYKGKATLLAADQSKLSWTSNPNLQPYPYDPAKAKQLLAQAGWTMGSDGYLHKNGQTLSLVYSTTAGNATREATERLIQFWFKQIGVKMTIKNVPANDFFGSLLPSGKGWDIAEYESLDSTDPPATTQQDFTPGGASDYGAFNNAQVNQLMQQVAVTTDQSKRQQLMQQVEQILHDQVPALWYFSPDEIDTSIGISGYQPNPWSVDTWNVYDWQLTN
ncbi:MAG: peptide ABC transporter substrate-binding protein [Alicyclobacillus sp.]|nr:peptide ABC transporter substrate-binding protein [Alicyclobacillus sp.]